MDAPRRLLFLLLACLFGSAVPLLRAQLKADKSPIDFGVQRQEQTLTAEIHLTNTGNTSLEILSVRPDCSCTAGVPEKSKLEPGESTKLKITVETRGYNGPLRRSIRVHTNEDSLLIPILLTVSPFKSWVLEPTTIVMPPSQRGQEAGMRVMLRYTGEGSAELGKISCVPAWLGAEAVRLDEKSWRVAFTKQAAAPAGNYTVKVTVQTNAPDDPVLSMNVFVPITSALKVSPNPVILPTVKVQQDSSREISIRGWATDSTPRLELMHGSTRLVAQEAGVWRFEITASSTQPGPSTQLLRIYSGSELEAEVPVILRAEPNDAEK